jgi:hypothetical protein
MQRWEYWVISLHDVQYTAALNELGSEGWELVSVTPEVITAERPKKSGAFPVPPALRQLEGAADKLAKISPSEPSGRPSAGQTSRLLWIFRRPLSDD